MSIRSRFARRVFSLSAVALSLSGVVWFGAASVLAQKAEPARRVYEGVVEIKNKTIGTLILMDVKDNSISGWIRLQKFVPIDGGSIDGPIVDFRAAGNSYKIDERRGRIIYSGPDGSADRLVTRLVPVTGTMVEVAESSRFSGNDVGYLEVGARKRRFTLPEPSLWKRQGPPFEKFSRPEELLEMTLTLWVSGDANAGSAEVIEEPEGMNIPLKPPKKTKEEKEKEKKRLAEEREKEKERRQNRPRY